MGQHWFVSPQPNVTPAQVRAGLKAMDESEAFAAGPESAIAAAVLELTSVTSRPLHIDDAKEVAYSEGLCRAMWDYPIDVVEAACRNWRRVPKHGNWWPSEAALREQCEEIVKPRREMRDTVARFLTSLENQTDNRRTLQPHGKTQTFVNLVTEALGTAYAKSWLSHRNCEFTDDRIFTTAIGVERLVKECTKQIKAAGVRLEVCQHVTKRFYADQDLMGETSASFTKKRKEYAR